MHQRILDTIAWLTKLDAAITEMEPFLPDESLGYFHMDHTVSYNFPYDPALIRTKIAEFENHGFKAQYHHQFTDDGVLMYELYREDIGFTFYFRPTMEGAACRLNKIGETTKVVPVYEVICANAEAAIELKG